MMAGTPAAAGVLACTVALVVGLAAVGAASAHAQRLASTADAAALAAADAASGAVTGIPCERADEIARTAGAQLDGCTLDGLIATVTVSASFATLPASASARAGPPP
jgi:secretion/DNA translocation related TadE-like protein